MSFRVQLHNLRTVSMPLGMVVGAMFCRPIAALEAWSGGMITPALIFLMLFFTFCRVNVRSMRLQPLHFWLLTAQIVFSLAVYVLLLPFDETVAQGGMICVLTPIAMAAVVIGGMLGADIVSMTTFSLLCNMAIALVAPVILSLTGNGACSFAVILAKVSPLLILPFAAAQACRALTPRAGEWVAAHSQISFYLWLISLAVIIGRTTTFILDHREADGTVETALAVAALAICLIQFKFGRWLGRRYGDAVAGGQSLGQKNTVLAVWMAQSFLDPISSVAPTAYIVWQNFVNSYQIYRKERRDLRSENKIDG